MNDSYLILTDSSADLDASLVQETGVSVLPLSFVIRGSSLQNWPDNRDLSPKEFYRLLRAGERATTSAVNLQAYLEFLRPVLQGGKDVLILAFSSGLSGTYRAAEMAAKELRPEFPDRKIFVVDTLCASMGQGLLVWYAARRWQAGESIEAVRDWCESVKLNVCHWFTVDDLLYLKRGGRVSAATAVVGTMLQIKPVLHVDNAGHLINMSKARGRKASLDALVSKVGETGTDPASQTIFISHSDCVDDAQYVADQIAKKYQTHDFRISYIGPVVGAHTGPGCVALFFRGRER